MSAVAAPVTTTSVSAACLSHGVWMTGSASSLRKAVRSPCRAWLIRRSEPRCPRATRAPPSGTHRGTSCRRRKRGTSPAARPRSASCRRPGCAQRSRPTSNTRPLSPAPPASQPSGPQCSQYTPATPSSSGGTPSPIRSEARIVKNCWPGNKWTRTLAPNGNIPAKVRDYSRDVGFGPGNDVHPKRHPATLLRHLPLRRVMRDLRSSALAFGAGAVCGNCRGCSCAYLPIIRMVNEPGTAAPWGPRPPPGGGGGAGPRSWLIVRMWFVLLSNAIVRAPFIV